MFGEPGADHRQAPPRSFIKDAATATVQSPVRRANTRRKSGHRAGRPETQCRRTRVGSFRLASGSAVFIAARRRRAPGAVRLRSPDQRPWRDRGRWTKTSPSDPRHQRAVCSAPVVGQRAEMPPDLPVLTNAAVLNVGAPQRGRPLGRSSAAAGRTGRQQWCRGSVGRCYRLFTVKCVGVDRRLDRRGGSSARQTDSSVMR